MRVIPVESRRLIPGKYEAVLESASGVDERFDGIVLMAGGRGVGAVVVKIHGRPRHGGVTAVWRVERFLNRRSWSVVRHRYVECVPRPHVECWLLQAVRRHKAEQRSSCLIRGL